MLHLEAVYPDTLDLLKTLMAREEFNPFALAGGTALALQIGHRISVDLDFFGKHDFDPEELLSTYAKIGDYQLLSQSKSVLVVSLRGIKVDVVNYRYGLLEPVRQIDNLRLLSLPDIAAMKLAAITGRGRKRDFIDLFFLLKAYSLPDMMDFYQRKFPDGSEFLVVKSLAYFEDAEEDEDPVLLEEADWQRAKSTIREEVNKLYQ